MCGQLTITCRLAFVMITTVGKPFGLPAVVIITKAKQSICSVVGIRTRSKVHICIMYFVALYFAASAYRFYVLAVLHFYGIDILSSRFVLLYPKALAKKTCERFRISKHHENKIKLKMYSSNVLILTITTLCAFFIYFSFQCKVFSNWNSITISTWCMLFNFEEFIVDKVKSRSKYPKFVKFHKSWHFLPEFTIQAEANIHVQCREITIYSPLVGWIL